MMSPGGARDDGKGKKRESLCVGKSEGDEEGGRRGREERAMGSAKEKKRAT